MSVSWWMRAADGGSGVDIRHPKWKEIEKEGKHVWASQLQRPPLVNFSSTDNGLLIIYYTTHIQTSGGFLLCSTTLSKGRCGKQLTVNTRLYHTHDITFFHTKGKRRKSSYSILTGKTFGDIDSYLLLLVFLWKCGILTEKLCELRACPISHSLCLAYKRLIMKETFHL